MWFLILLWSKFSIFSPTVSGIAKRDCDVPNGLRSVHWHEENWITAKVTLIFLSDDSLKLWRVCTAEVITLAIFSFYFSLGNRCLFPSSTPTSLFHVISNSFFLREARTDVGWTPLFDKWLSWKLIQKSEIFHLRNLYFKCRAASGSRNEAKISSSLLFAVVMFPF